MLLRPADSRPRLGAVARREAVGVLVGAGLLSVVLVVLATRDDMILTIAAVGVAGFVCVVAQVAASGTEPASGAAT